MKKFKLEAPATIRIACTREDKEEIFEIKKSEAFIGRRYETFQPDLDLSPDTTSSRHHARIWVEDGVYWVEDLGSKLGTQVNGKEIKGRGAVRLPIGVFVHIGKAQLRLLTPGTSLEEPVALPAEPDGHRTEVKIDSSLDVHVEAVDPKKAPSEEVIQRQALLLALPLEFATDTPLNDLLQTVVQRALEIIGGAERGTLLLCDRHRDALLLAAFVSADAPAVSETLARQALKERRGFIWRRGGGTDLALSMQRHAMQSGMYAPLIWHDKPLGVICVDNPFRESAFSEDDLRLLLSVAHYAAMAVANHHLRNDLQEKSVLLERLLANFSPRLREKLLAKARQGRLRPGGEKSEVTILFSDIRGFTKMSAGMDAHDVVDLLNDYFPALADAIFKFDGTIDKFVGDAILAVFGSPERDTAQHEKALRAAWAMQEAIRTVNEQRAARGDVTCQIGIGLHCGEVFHGFIGAKERLEFTVIGDAVNRTARICDGAGAGEILFSPELHQRAYKSVQAEKSSIATKHEGDFTVFRLKGMV
jgi:adenylate cyclase